MEIFVLLMEKVKRALMVVLATHRLSTCEHSPKPLAVKYTGKLNLWCVLYYFSILSGLITKFSLESNRQCERYNCYLGIHCVISILDRAALNIIEEAEANGTLRAGGTIVEGTGGNTGIALAQLGISRGYTVVLCMPQSISIEKIDYMRQLGAEVHLQPGVPFSDPRHYAKLAESIAKERGAIHTNQFENIANFRSHFAGTGPEVWGQTSHNIDIFVAAAGTGNGTRPCIYSIVL
jgi:cysteine synthase